MHINGAGRAALYVVALLLVACGGGEEEGYTEEFNAAFVDTCVDAEGSPGEDACRCWSEGVQDNIPFEDLPELDRLVAGDDPEDLPEEPFQILARCSVNAAPAPTVPTTTTQPPPSTTATTVAP